MIIAQGYPLFAVRIDESGEHVDMPIPIVAWSMTENGRIAFAILCDGTTVSILEVMGPKQKQDQSPNWWIGEKENG